MTIRITPFKAHRYESTASILREAANLVQSGRWVKGDVRTITDNGTALFSAGGAIARCAVGNETVTPRSDCWDYSYSNWCARVERYPT